MRALAAGTPKEKAERERTDFLKATDTAGRVVDFHNLRHTYVTRVVRSGASAKVAQDLARHSTPALTLGVYTHMTVHDHSAALDALPPIEWGEPEHQAARATATEDAAPDPTEGRPARSAFSARRLPEIPSPVITRQEQGLNGRKGRSAQALKKRPPAHRCPHLSWWARRESNPHRAMPEGILSPQRLPFRHSPKPFDYKHVRRFAKVPENHEITHSGMG